MNVELTINCEEVESLGIPDGGVTEIHSGCYMSKDANFYHVELGMHKIIGEPVIRVTGHNLEDEEVTRYVLVDPLNDDFRTLAGLIYNSEYLGEV